MYKFYKILLLLLSLSSIILAGEKKVLVEIFTNAHCPLCPPSHSAIDQYLQTSNADKIEYIYYHMAFPYNTDQLYQHNKSDSENKNNFYGPYSSTPKAFFNGIKKANNYSGWASELDGLVAEDSKFDLSVTGTAGDSNFTITATVTKTAEINKNDLTINFVVVEDINNYTGQNGVSDNKNVMRKIVNPIGDPFEIGLNETKELSATLEFNSVWNKDNVKIVVFVQSSSSKEVFQTSSITYNELEVTGIENKKNVSSNFILEQNYPNPFNPSTTIQYSIPSSFNSHFTSDHHRGQNGNTASFVTLKVYDVIGNEVATLVNGNKASGIYTVNFNGSNLTSGIYYYTLSAGNFSATKKLILLK